MKKKKKKNWLKNQMKCSFYISCGTFQNYFLFEQTSEKKKVHETELKFCFYTILFSVQLRSMCFNEKTKLTEQKIFLQSSYVLFAYKAFLAQV